MCKSALKKLPVVRKVFVHNLYNLVLISGFSLTFRKKNFREIYKIQQIYREIVKKKTMNLKRYEHIFKVHKVKYVINRL